MSYDNACYQLAEKFLDDETRATAHDKHVLAQKIQDVVEDYIKFELAEEEK